MRLFKLYKDIESLANLPPRLLQSQPGLGLGNEQGPASRPESDGHWAASHNPPGGAQEKMRTRTDVMRVSGTAWVTFKNELVEIY